MTKYSLEERIEIYARPLEDQFIPIFRQGDAVVFKHLIRSTMTCDYVTVFEVAKALALEKNGPVYILPEINAHEYRLRQKLGLSTTDGYTPDIMTETGIFVDVKSPEKIDRITANACKAYKQGGIACITDHSVNLDKGLIDKYAKWVLDSQGYHFDDAYFYIGGVLYKRAKEKILGHL